MITNNLIVMNLIEDFLEETNYEVKPINRDVEVGDMFDVNRETGKLINYGSTDDIVNTEEFKEWFKLKLGEGNTNE